MGRKEHIKRSRYVVLRIQFNAPPNTHIFTGPTKTVLDGGDLILVYIILIAAHGSALIILCLELIFHKIYDRSDSGQLQGAVPYCSGVHELMIRKAIIKDYVAKREGIRAAAGYTPKDDLYPSLMEAICPAQGTLCEGREDTATRHLLALQLVLGDRASELSVKKTLKLKDAQVQNAEMHGETGQELLPGGWSGGDKVQAGTAEADAGVWKAKYDTLLTDAVTGRLLALQLVLGDMSELSM